MCVWVNIKCFLCDITPCPTALPSARLNTLKGWLSQTQTHKPVPFLRSFVCQENLAKGVKRNSKESRRASEMNKSRENTGRGGWGRMRMGHGPNYNTTKEKLARNQAHCPGRGRLKVWVIMTGGRMGENLAEKIKWYAKQEGDRHPVCVRLSCRE